MRYETFNPEVHDVFKVAKLVYDVDFRTFDMLFKNSNNLVKIVLTKFNLNINNNPKIVKPKSIRKPSIKNI